MSTPVDRLVGTTQLGKLRVIRLLGRGGMGAVYEVEHLKTHHRRALKVLLPQIALSDEAVRRFEREATVAGRLKTPHVVETLDAGQLEDGSAYVLMEFLEGSTLGDAIKKAGRLSTARTAEILRQACEALRVAHDHGIVHRDLKPENLFLQKGSQGSDSLKVLDFGISKFIGEHFSEGGTKDSSLLGTPAYMSPEQLQNSRDVDGRSDVYALGVIAYEALAGEPPYQAPTFYELALKIIKGEHASLADLLPQMDPAWVAVVNRAMHADREQRYQSVGALQAALEELGGTASPYESSPPTRVSASPGVSAPAPLLAENTVSIPESSSQAVPIPLIAARTPAGGPAQEDSLGPVVSGEAPWRSPKVLLRVVALLAVVAVSAAVVLAMRDPLSGGAATPPVPGSANGTASAAPMALQPPPSVSVDAPKLPPLGAKPSAESPRPAVPRTLATARRTADSRAATIPAKPPPTLPPPSATPPSPVPPPPAAKRTQAESVGLETQNPY